LGGTGPIPDELPLLGSARGGHYFDAFCKGKPRSTPLPPDPRTLIVPGANEGKAVYFNAWWHTCRSEGIPQTCGDHRDAVARGLALVGAVGAVSSGSEFAGNSPDSSFAVPVDDY